MSLQICRATHAALSLFVTAALWGQTDAEVPDVIIRNMELVAAPATSTNAVIVTNVISVSPLASTNDTVVVGTNVSTNAVATVATPPPTAFIKPEELIEFESQPLPVQDLLRQALSLTERNLTYMYGSASPDKGGFDCSGFVYYVLGKVGIKDIPRQSNLQYVWVRKAGNFRAVVSTSNDTFELDEMQPGDLMFWTGTYDVVRDPPVTHTMIYLGRQKKDKQRVMVGASSGRRYNNIARNGASVFDFKQVGFPPPKNMKLGTDFIGYGAVPGLREASAL